MKKILFTLLCSFCSHLAFAISEDAAKTELTKGGWIEVADVKTKIFGEVAALDFYSKNVQTEGFGRKPLLVAVDGKNERIWFGPEVKLMYAGKEKIRGVGFFSLAGSLHILGKSFPLAAFVNEEKFTRTLTLLESCFHENPFFWSTSCISAKHFEKLRNEGEKKVQSINRAATGELLMKVKTVSDQIVTIPLGFDHDANTCVTVDDLNSARANERAYPAGYFGWKRGQPSKNFDFQFDGDLDAKITEILTSK